MKVNIRKGNLFHSIWYTGITAGEKVEILWDIVGLLKRVQIVFEENAVKGINGLKTV